MHTFSYTPDPDNPHDKNTVSISTNADNLLDLVEAFERYLKATGFVFDGQLDIVKEDEPNN